MKRDKSLDKTLTTVHVLRFCNYAKGYKIKFLQTTFSETRFRNQNKKEIKKDVFILNKEVIIL